MLRVLVGGAVLHNGLDGLGKGVHDGLDVLGGLMDLVRLCLAMLPKPFVHCAIDVHVQVPQLHGNLGEEHGLCDRPGEHHACELAVAEWSQAQLSKSMTTSEAG